MQRDGTPGAATQRGLVQERQPGGLRRSRRRHYHQEDRDTCAGQHARHQAQSTDRHRVVPVPLVQRRNRINLSTCPWR